MSVGTEPPFGWGGEEPVEAWCLVKTGFTTAALGLLCAIDYVNASTFAVGAKDGPLYTVRVPVNNDTGAGAADPRGWRGIIIDLGQSLGAEGTLVLVQFRGIMKALVSSNTGAAIAPGAKLGMGTTYLDSLAAAGNACVAYLGDSGFTPSGGGVTSIKQVYFNGIQQAYGLMP